MRQIAIIGVGFIGGCLASSIKKLKICDRLVGIERSPETVSYTHLTLPTNREV